jgi:hypothetical protein
MQLAGNVSNLLRVEGESVTLRRKSGGAYDIDEGKMVGESTTDYTVTARLSRAKLDHAETFQEVMGGDEIALFAAVDLTLWGAGGLQAGDQVIPVADPVPRRVVEIQKRKHSHMALLRRAG